VFETVTLVWKHKLDRIGMTKFGLKSFKLICLCLATAGTLVCDFGMAATQTSSFDDWQALDAQESEREKTYQTYAKWVMDNNDANQDGSLSEFELGKMQGPLSERRFDKNSDGKLSFDEIVGAIRRPSSDVVTPEAKPLVDAGADDRASKTEIKLRRYASSLIRQYDADQNGSLNSSELRAMRKPFSLEIDSDRNGEISEDEATADLLNQSKTQDASQPLKKQSPAPTTDSNATIVIGPGYDRSTQAMGKRLLEAALIKNDKNGDRVLDGKEIAQAKWSTDDWKRSDVNRDGELDETELQTRYEQFFLRMAANVKQNGITDQATAKSNELTNAPAGLLSGEMLEIMKQLSGSNSRDGLAAISRTRKRLDVPSENVQHLVDVKLYLVRVPEDTAASMLSSEIDKLKNSPADFSEAVEGFVDKLGVTSFDQVVMSAKEGQQATLVSGGTDFIKAAAAGGRSQVHNQLEIGLNVRVSPTVERGGIFLELEISKTELIESSDENQAIEKARLATWSYESVAKISAGRPVVIGSSSSGQRWILAVDASVTR
jgi:hypothetical protein